MFLEEKCIEGEGVFHNLDFIKKIRWTEIYPETSEVPAPPFLVEIEVFDLDGGVEIYSVSEDKDINNFFTQMNKLTAGN